MNPSTSNRTASTDAAEFVVYSHPTGAEAFLDGERVGTTPLSIRGVEPGFHQIRLIKDGFDPYETRLRAGSGETETVHGELARRFGRLGVLVRPSIYINGVLLDKATDVKYMTSLPVGEYTVTAVHPDLGSVEKTVRIDAVAIEEIVIESHRARSRSSVHQMWARRSLDKNGVRQEEGHFIRSYAPQ